MIPESADQWYVTEVEPHRHALRAWLLTRFQTLPDVDNIVQEAMARVLRARATGTIRSPRALLFTTARNLAFDLVRRQRLVRFESLTDDLAPFVLDEDADVFATVRNQEELEVLTKAIQSLPERCRQVLTLRTVYGLAQAQIAGKLGVSVSTVEKLTAQAIRDCADFFASGRGR